MSIFVCPTRKAVHIELVSDLTTEAFLAALNDSSRDAEKQNIYIPTM